MEEGRGYEQNPTGGSWWGFCTLRAAAPCVWQRLLERTRDTIAWNPTPTHTSACNSAEPRIGPGACSQVGFPVRYHVITGEETDSQGDCVKEDSRLPRRFQDNLLRIYNHFKIMKKKDDQLSEMF